MIIKGDSQLVLKQVAGEYKCRSLSLAPYFTAAIQLLESLEEVTFLHVPREENWEADQLAQIASGMKMSKELTHKLVLIQKRSHPSIQQRGINVEVFNTDVGIAGDWRDEFKKYLENPNVKAPHKLKVQTQNFVFLGGELYRKGFDGLLLRCLSFPDAMEVMKQVHEGICGAHQAGIKMRWLLRRQRETATFIFSRNLF